MVWGLFPVDPLSGENKYYIFKTGVYKVGRKGCDVIINKQNGVSRVHSEIIVNTMDMLNPLSNKHCHLSPGIQIRDCSKYGTFISKSDGPMKKVHELPNKETTLQDGDLVSFGTGNATYKFCHVSGILFISSSNQVDQSLISSIARMAPMTDVELKEYLKKVSQEKGVQAPSGASTQANLSGVITRKRKNDAVKGAAVKQGNPITPLVVEPLKTVYVASSTTPPPDNMQLVSDLPSWGVIVKSVESEFKKMNDANKKQLKELEGLKEKIKESETRIAKVDTLEKEVGRLKKDLEEAKNKQSEREKELKAEKDKATSDLELERGIAESLREEVAKKNEGIAKLLEEVDGLKLKAAIKHQAGFENALKQVQFRHSEASLFKVVRDGKLVVKGDADNGVGNEEMIDSMAIDGGLENEGKHHEEDS